MSQAVSLLLNNEILHSKAVLTSLVISCQQTFLRAGITKFGMLIEDTPQQLVVLPYKSSSTTDRPKSHVYL